MTVAPPAVVVTVTDEVAVLPAVDSVPEMVAEPAATPVTTPEELTVATDVSEEVHVTV